MKSIYILLSRTQSLLSRTVQLLTDDPYTHASIAFDPDFHVLYSSARWNGFDMFPSGPCREYLHKGFYSRKQTPCAVYELFVQDSVHEAARKEVADILAHQGRYHFNVIGLLFCRLHIPLRRRHHFFCSQFVAEILQRSGALELPADPCLIRPSDYTRLPQLRFCFQGYTCQLKKQMMEMRAYR